MKPGNLDPYQILNVTPSATTDVIQRAYRMLALQYHPDRNASPRAAALMAALNEAYKILGDPVHRAAYDREQAQAEPDELMKLIVQAAKAHVLKSGWKAASAAANDMVLEMHPRRMHLRFSPRMRAAELQKWQAMVQSPGAYPVGLSIALTAQLDVPEESLDFLKTLSEPALIIDLMYSQRFGSPFPDHEYGKPFAAFLREPG